MTHHITLPLLLALLPLAAGAQDKCIAQAEAEQDHIIREYSGHPPARGDKDAALTWSRNLHAALAANAERAEDCARASRAANSPATAAKELECVSRSNRDADELVRRYRGRTLTAQEQATRRAEEQRLLDERISCTSHVTR